MTLLNSRGGSTTHPSSFLIGRPTKVCTLPSDSLAPYWRGPNNDFLWFFLNALATNGSSEHLYSLSTTSPFLFLLKKPAAVLQGISFLSQTDHVDEYTIGLRLTYYDYSSTGIEDQNPNNGQ
ncbi:hypothetical protein TNCV_3499111 [Trichonephila clavipes]|nr:hypothetical protein TNCV_3499111 [Trichonephila clavipes]